MIAIVLRYPATVRWLFVGLCVVLPGCSGGSTVPVEGIVTLDGKPLTDASVTLSQMRASDPGPFFGTTDADGHFALGTGEDPGSGAAPGQYRLMITTVKQEGGGMEDSPPPTKKEVVPAQFHNGSQTFEVPAGGTLEANFDMKSR